MQGPDDPEVACCGGIALVWQDRALFPNLSVARAVVGGVPRLECHRQRCARAEAVLVPHGTTFGEGRRRTESMPEPHVVGIARALLRGPLLTVMEGPDAPLPQVGTDSLTSIVRPLAARAAAIDLVGEHLQQVIEICERVTVLRDRHMFGVVARSAPPRRGRPSQWPDRFSTPCLRCATRRGAVG